MKTKGIDVAQEIREATVKGATKRYDFDVFDDILREAREKSKRKNTVLSALFDMRFTEPGEHILVRFNAGKDKKSRKVRVAQRAVKIGVDRRDIPQIYIIGDIVEDGNKITDKVSLAHGTEMIDFISANK